mmetsp:Transcript_56722/g.106688  ORF Transcript_56722/g.106688 Transcript_56722/m.106688 type:complete len:212 (-) Transcript_56722:310-945(-)
MCIKPSAGARAAKLMPTSAPNGVVSMPEPARAGSGDLPTAASASASTQRAVGGRAATPATTPSGNRRAKNFAPAPASGCEPQESNTSNPRSVAVAEIEKAPVDPLSAPPTKRSKSPGDRAEPARRLSNATSRARRVTTSSCTKRLPPGWKKRTEFATANSRTSSPTSREVEEGGFALGTATNASSDRGRTWPLRAITSGGTDKTSAWTSSQ